MSHSPVNHRVWTQHVIAPCTRLEHLPVRIEPAGSDIPLARIPEARRATAMRVLEGCRGEIAERLALGAVGFECAGRRHVLLWDLMDVSVAVDGSGMQVAWPAHGKGMGVAKPRADLSIPIGGYAWPTIFDPILFEAWRGEGLDVHMLGGGPTGEWMRHTLRRTFRRYVDWNRLRRAVLAYLRLDPLVVSIMRRLFEGDCPDIDHFNWVHRNASELARIAIESPRLLPFLRLVGRKEAGTPLENLEALLQAGGIAPSARRKLERWGYPAFDAAIDSALFHDFASVAAGFANLLDRLQVEDEPPVVFAQLAVDQAGAFKPDWFLRALLEELRRLEGEDLGDMPPFAWEDALAWLASGPAEPDENQRRGGWEWIESQAEKFAATGARAAMDAWPVPCEAFESGPWRIVPIRNHAELREEARAMRNCLEKFEGDCAAGRLAIFSIRELEGGKRVACFSMARVAGSPGDWKLMQIAGEANAEVPHALVDPAIEALRRCSPAA